MIKTIKTKYSDNFSYYENDTIIGKSLELYGEYAEIEINFLNSMLNEHCTVWDVGSNIGVHAVAFATKSKFVICFEPNQNNLKLLLKNTENLQNVAVVNAAASNKNSTISIQDFNPNIPDNYGMVKANQGTKFGLSIKLDDWIFPKPDLVKIDVETMEWQVLQGMDNTIKKFLPVIFFEAHETPDLPEIYDYLTDLGYILYWMQSPNFNKNNFNKNSVDYFKNSGTISILSVPPGQTQHPINLNRVKNRNDSAQKIFERNKKRWSK